MTPFSAKYYRNQEAAVLSRKSQSGGEDCPGAIQEEERGPDRALASAEPGTLGRAIKDRGEREMNGKIMITL